MTEVVSAATFLEPELGVARINSVGRAMMLSEVELIDAGGRRILEPDIRGEVRIRGENVIRGYWQRPEASAEAFSADGWFRTGDVGYFDADGFLYVCDRIKDMIISGGENVYAAEVESVLLEHPAVANAAAVGAPDERWGEIVVAVLVLKPGHSLTLEALVAFCGPRLARYKLPKRLRIVDEMPLNGAGKIVKQTLRQLLECDPAASA
jgi:fatty-acyl-CoA synthase